MNDSSTIIQNGFVFACDSQQRTGPWTILVRGGRIEKLSTSGEAMRSMYPAAEVVDATGKVILPGFIDPHMHGESFLLQAATASIPASRWTKESSVARSMTMLRESFAQEDLKRAYELAYFAALRSGVTTLFEFGFDREGAPAAAAVEALRRTDLNGVVGIHNGDQAEIARQVKRPSVRFSVVLPDEESLTTYSLQTRARLAREEQWSVTLALGETRRASELVRKNFQRSVMQLADEYGLLNMPLHVMHLAFLEDADVDLLTRARLPVIVSASSVLEKMSDVPPFVEYLRSQIPVARGTDWGISDPRANVRNYIAMVRILGMTPPRPESLLAMITSIPARALGMHAETGTIEPGKRADLTLLDVSDFRFGGGAHRNASELLADVLFHATRENVSDVMVRGEFFVRGGTFLTMSDEDLVRDTRTLRQRLMGPMKAESELAIAEPASPDPRPAEDDLPFEEGFRVKGKSDAADRVFPLPERRTSGPELSSSARRVFGDDDQSV